MEEVMVLDMVEDMEEVMVVVTMAKDLLSLVMDMVGMAEAMVHIMVDMEEDMEAIAVMVEDMEVGMEVTENGLPNLDMVDMEAVMVGDMVEHMDLVMVAMVEAMVEAIL
eukprot:TRINITY_DN11489_c0_g1_i4.p4 TRINITY_DN11489_c0_g1~~TRINITY_DN11489_c0_g1_i4.p4  ORF type:complete len:109 (+),score=39.60 TRINITY_DN11489_c0_g1_i4:209-535(+)